MDLSRLIQTPTGDLGDVPVAIPLNRGMFAFCDARDWQIVRRHQWTYRAPTRGRATGYAVTQAFRGGKRYQLSMHRLLVMAPADAFIDHVDRNGLNNTRANLRVADKSGNAINVRKTPASSGYIGVYKAKKGPSFEAKLGKHRKSIYIGKFADPKFAARVRDIAARIVQGEFAVLNFPESINDPLDDIPEETKARLAFLAENASGTLRRRSFGAPSIVNFDELTTTTPGAAGDLPNRESNWGANHRNDERPIHEEDQTKAQHGRAEAEYGRD